MLYNEYFTRDYVIMAGVPQGSVLLPTLYMIFTADSEQVLTCTFIDDTAIFISHCNPVIASSELNCHLERLKIWYNNWRIRINVLKSATCYFHIKKRETVRHCFLIILKALMKASQFILEVIWTDG